MIRVLHLVGTLDPGGVETWLMSVLRKSDRARVQMDFCTFAPGKGIFAAEAESLGSKVYSCPMDQESRSLSRRFRAILREGKYDVVHSHVHYFSGAFLRWANQEGVPRRISHSHSTHDGKRSSIVRRGYRSAMRFLIRRHATLCLAASQAAARALYGQDWKSDARVLVLHYGIDLRPFSETVDSRAVRAELGLPQGVPVIGHVGRFVEPKNHSFLVEIAREVIARRPDCQFLLVGDGQLRSAVEAQIGSYGLSKNVHVTGTRHDVPRIMLGAMDAFLLPSIWEGLGLVLIEAQAAGLPCVASDRVPSEVVILSERVTFASITDGAEVWRDLLLGLLGRPTLQREGCIERVSRSDFAIERSVWGLENLYAS